MQEPLDLDAASKVIAKHANRRGLEIHLEPGDYLVKDAGVLLLQVNTEDIELPAVSEGDYLALLNTGGYGSASSSNH